MFIASFLLSAVLAALPAAHAETPLLLTESSLHDADALIIDVLGYDDASVIYFRELGSVTEQQLKDRRVYEPVGCDPLYVMKNGVIAEAGFNCRTFFCVGYKNGPKLCRMRDGRPYGGVVEISRRANLPFVRTVRTPFASFDEADRTDEMNRRTRELAAVRCSPYYIMLFDLAVGEGYDCEEVGQYPYFSSANRCENDWRTTEGLTCDVALREDEMDIRRRAIDRREEGSGSGTLVDDDDATSSGALLDDEDDPAQTASGTVVSFPDVEAGKYGYTAIMDLAATGIVRGYEDGTFRPYQSVNRAEFAKLLMEGLYADQLRDEVGCFPDVGRSWYASAVCAMRRLRWVRGYEDGLFRAERTMLKAEGMKVVVASLNLQLDSPATLPQGTPDGQWYSPYVRKAVELRLLLEPFFYPGNEVTRADAAVWMYRARKHLGIR